MSTLYQTFFALIYDKVMNKVELDLSPLRKELISDMEGNILEIGFGTGVNFKFYNPNANVVAIDPSKAMVKRAKKKIDSNCNIKLVHCGVGDSVYLKEIKNRQFDAIISTLVLCTIPEPEKAISQFYNQLNSGGKLIVLEHIQHDHSFMKKLYNVFNPVWKRLADGCNINRSTDQYIKSAGFISATSSSEQYFKKGIPFYANVFIKE